MAEHTEHAAFGIRFRPARLPRRDHPDPGRRACLITRGTGPHHRRDHGRATCRERDRAGPGPAWDTVLANAIVDELAASTRVRTGPDLATELGYTDQAHLINDFRPGGL